MLIVFLFYSLSFIFSFVLAVESPICPASKSPGQLAAVAVWAKEDNNGSFIYRLSDESLADDGYTRSPVDRDNFVVLLARGAGECDVGSCSMKLSTNRRDSDDMIIHQENVFGVPDGYTDLHDDFYCARSPGDCGADVPLIRFTKGKGPNAKYAYSLDGSASFPGYIRDSNIICYGWADSGSVVHPPSGDYQCLQQRSIANGMIKYSTAGSGAFSVGTTAELICDPNYVGGGQSAILCTKQGWYPASGLGYCIQKNDTSLISGNSILESQSECAAAANVVNGQIVYSMLGDKGRFPTKTTATVMCHLGYVISGEPTVTCQDGRWNPRQLATCHHLSTVRCMPMLPPMSGKIIYESLDAPYALGATARLTCPLGSTVRGVDTLQCNSTGWAPNSFGVCMPGTGIPCGAILATGGTASYIQANPTVLYSSGTTVFLMCNAGYTLSGAGSSFCSSGVWTPAIGTCNLNPASGVNSGSAGATCFDIGAPINGQISYTPVAALFTPHPSGTIASLTCNAGFVVSGSLSSTCTSGTWTPATIGTCQTAGSVPGSSLQSCAAAPIVPIGGTISYSNGAIFAPFPAATIATLQCTNGALPQGTISVTCINGQWSPATLGTCGTGTAGSQCAIAIPTPIGATLTYSNGAIFAPFNSGVTVTAICAGSIMNGASTSTCTNGQWNPATLGVCGSGGTGTQCPVAPPTPMGATMTYSNGAIFPPFNNGITVTATCPGSIINGASTSTCLNGQWSPPTLGLCSASTGGGTTQCTMAPPTPIGATLQYSNGAIFPPFNGGVTVTATCPGSVINGASTATCTNGQWSPPTLGTCGSNGIGGGTQCSIAPPTPIGATLSYSNGAIFPPFNNGITVTATCPGSFINGASTATCSNGQWNPPTLGTCGSGGGGSQCAIAPPTPMGATLSYSNGAIFPPFNNGITVTATCPGSFINGASTATCSNGQWNPPTLGTCGSGGGGTQCAIAPPTPMGATLSYSNGAIFPPFNNGITVTATCPGSFINGASTATCSNGQWNPPTLGTCGGSGGSGTQCSVAPPTPIGATLSYSNGAIFPPFNNGITVTATCPGSFINGASTATCSNGQWNPPNLGTCGSNNGGGTQCSVAPPTPTGATLSYSNGAIFPPFNNGITVTATCPGSFINGASTSTCSNGQWNPPTLGTCGSAGGSQCPSAPPTPIGATLSYSNGAIFPPFNNGITVTATCPGSFINGASTSTCSNGQWNPPNLSTCNSNSGGGAQCSAAPQTPIGATLSYSNGAIFPPFNNGITVTATCPGSFINGASTATCSNGQWNPTTLGTCNSNGGGGTQCTSAPPTPVGATLSYSNGAIFPPFNNGITVTATCPGSFINGASTATCSNGQWNPPNLGTCNSNGGGTQCSVAPPTPTGATLSYSNGAIFPPFNNGITVTATCPGSFINGASTSTCSNGQWNPSTLGTCNSNGGGGSQCSVAPPTPMGATLSYSNGAIFPPFNNGITVTATCPGSFINGASTATCSNGQWSPPTLGTCNSNGGGGTQCSVAPPTPMGATLSYSNGAIFPPFNNGITVTATCPGSFINGASTATCSNGQWNPPTLGTCGSSGSGGTQCSVAPPTPMGATMSYSNGAIFPPFNNGITVTATCPGSFINGASTATCSNGQWNPPTLGTCNSNGNGGAQCPVAPPTPFGATLSYSSGILFGPFTSGTVATARCTTGTISGASTTTCSNGQWNPSSMGTCTGTGTGGTTCSPISQPLNGVIDYGSNQGQINIPNGATATLICTSGSPIGSALSTCQNGNWVPLIGSCSANGGTSTTSCSAAPVAPFGVTFSYSNGAIFAPWPQGTTATMTCGFGQSPQGTTISTCQNGQWTPLGTCGSGMSDSSIGCSPFGEMGSVVDGGRTVYIPSVVDHVTLGTRASLLCRPGFVPNGERSATCTLNGWVPSTLGNCLAQGTSTDAACSAIGTPLNAQVSYSQGVPFGPYPTGATASAACNPGFFMNGAATSICQNGAWVPPSMGVCQIGNNGNQLMKVPSSAVAISPQCTKGFPSIINGNINYSNSQPLGPWSSGTKATVSCSASYHIAGNNFSTCQNGHWQPSSLGQCLLANGMGKLPNTCKDIPEIQYGKVTYSQLTGAPYSEGSTAYLMCSIGNRLVGLSEVTCLGGGWTPFPGLGSCVHVLSREPIGEGGAFDAVPYLNVNVGTVGCKTPIAPAYGEISYSRESSSLGFPSGTTAALRCSLGFSVIGPSFSTCTRGAFRPILGRCEDGQKMLPGDCIPLSPPPNGRITYIQSGRENNFEIGTTALLYCAETHAVTGQATLICTAQGWEPSEGFGQCDSTNSIS